MSVTTTKEVVIEPILGQDQIVRFKGYVQAIGDATGGYVEMQLFLPDVSVLGSAYYFTIRHLNAVALNRAIGGELLLKIYSADYADIAGNPLSLFRYIDLTGSPAGGDDMMLINATHLMFQFPNFMYKITRGGLVLMPFVCFQFSSNVNATIYQSSVGGYMISERAMKMMSVMPM